MKQLIQDFKSGDIELVDVPPPACGPGLVLVRNAFSLVSAGTEKATVSLGQQSLLGKARSRPDLVKQVIETVRHEGLSATVRKVQSRLDRWKALGYATAGTVIEIGAGVEGFSVGDRVACAGQDYASHAAIVAVPQNLCARVPDGVDLSHASFTTVGAIALQGIRQAEVRLGEVVAVIGLGLVGQLTVQLLKAAGCVVIGVDVNSEACALARRSGADAVVNSTESAVEPVAAQLSHGFGVDAVIITATTSSSEPIELAGKLCRERGCVVMVGVTGMEVPRPLFYQKELQFKLSRSYGPGRYDPLYEERGIDYPVGYVRWTEGRNLAAFVALLACKRIDMTPLITHAFPIDNALQAYDLITGKFSERFVGVLISYPTSVSQDSRSVIPSGSRTTAHASRNSVVLGVIGAGNYAQGVLLPQFKGNKDVTLRTACTSTGINAKKAAEKFGFESCTTDWQQLLQDNEINTVLIATRHDLHAAIVMAALRAGKAVFCEKPLCLTAGQLDEIVNVIRESGNDRLMVGFNRRFAPFAADIGKLNGPRVMRYRVSASPLPPGHWTGDPQLGGGRILGEVCHFIDFLRFAAQARAVSVFAQGFGSDNVQIAMRFADDSVGSIDYFTVADPALGKEHFEIFGGARHIVVDDFHDRGQANEVRLFVDAVKSGRAMPIPLDQLVESTRATFAVVRSMQTGASVSL